MSNPVTIDTKPRILAAPRASGVAPIRLFNQIQSHPAVTAGSWEITFTSALSYNASVLLDVFNTDFSEELPYKAHAIIYANYICHIMVWFNAAGPGAQIFLSTGSTTSFIKMTLIANNGNDIYIGENSISFIPMQSATDLYVVIQAP